jgi:hypothetical protein
MTISGPAVKSQVKGQDEVMEPYSLPGIRIHPLLAQASGFCAGTGSVA